MSHRGTRTDPTAATDKPNQRTSQLIKSVVEDGDGRRTGKLVKGISGMAPAADVKRNWSKLYPEPETQPGDSETLPFTEEDKQSFLCQLLLAINQVFSLQQSHGTWWWKVRAPDVDDPI